jgi:hypothetical protein
MAEINLQPADPNVFQQMVIHSRQRTASGPPFSAVAKHPDTDPQHSEHNPFCISEL